MWRYIENITMLKLGETQMIYTIRMKKYNKPKG